MPSMMSVVVIGRLMNSAARFMIPPSAGAAPLMLMRLPGTSRSWPSVTTVSPGLTPSLITVSVPAVRATSTGAHLDGLIGLDDVDVLSVRARLHGDRRHDDRARIGGQPHAHVDELTGPEPAIRIRERGLDPDRAGRLIDRLSTNVMRPVARAELVVRRQRLHARASRCAM